jgi:hypothetical protein
MRLCEFLDYSDELVEEDRRNSRIDHDEAHEWKVERERIPEFSLVPEIVGHPIRLNKNRDQEIACQ